MSTIARELPIPLCDLSAQHAPLTEEIRAAIDQVLESQQFIMGPQVAELEGEIADYCDVGFGIGCSSGSDALLMALMALGITAGDEVITTPFTFFATAGAVARLGATPVFVDIEPNGLNIDSTLIEAAITPRTKVILPVHLFGQMADMDPIMEIAAARDLYVVEDAAQALGARYRGRRAGSIGHMGCFSFFPSKNLGCLGDGGAVITGDPVLAEKLRVLRAHGAQPKYFHATIGGNFRLDTIHAATLLVKLRHLDKWNALRRDVAERYRDLLANVGLTSALTLPTELPDAYHIYNQFCLRSPQRDAVIQHLKDRQIGTATYYPLPLHLQECFRNLRYGEDDFPVSELAAREVFTVPMFPGLTREQQERVVGTLASAV